MHMAVARLGCKRTVVGTRWANSWPGCMSRLRKCYSHLSGGSFLAGKASWALSGCFISGREGFLGSKRVFANREC